MDIMKYIQVTKTEIVKCLTHIVSVLLHSLKCDDVHLYSGWLEGSLSLFHISLHQIKTMTVKMEKNSDKNTVTPKHKMNLGDA